MRINTLCILICASFIIVGFGGCSRRSGKLDSVQIGELPPLIEIMPDTAKVRMLIDAGVSADSLAAFVVDCADGRHEGVSFSEFDAVEDYVAEHLGEAALNSYDVSFEANLQSLTLDKKFNVLRSMRQAEEQLLGYTLGLEYVNRVVDHSLGIGKVDFEIAEFKRACDADESVYNDFLVGFAAGISHTPADMLPGEVITKYGKKQHAAAEDDMR